MEEHRQAFRVKSVVGNCKEERFGHLGDMRIPNLSDPTPAVVEIQVGGCQEDQREALTMGLLSLEA